MFKKKKKKRIVTFNDILDLKLLTLFLLFKNTLLGKHTLTL